MSSTIKVLVRMRPAKPGETHDTAIHIHDHCSQPDTSSCVKIPTTANRADAEFRFSSCFNDTATQSDVFKQDVAPLIPSVFKGLTVTVMAYGVTSSGKTYTIEGSNRDPGITPRVIEGLFASMPESCTPTVSMSYMELYKEDVYDLLADPGKKSKLQIREKVDGEVFVDKLSSALIRSVKDFRKIYDKATKQRAAGSTKLNEGSSRSHAILTFETVVVDTVSNRALTGRFRIVDLAGSENNKLTGNTEAARMAESSSINKSLTTLSKVVKAINDGASRIPYRDSKLTRILQNSLGGNAVCLMICNIAPVLALRRDVYNTLLFASGVQKVKNKPKANISVLPTSNESASLNNESQLRRSARGHETRRWESGEVIVLTPTELQELVQKEVQAAVALALASAAAQNSAVKQELVEELPVPAKQEAVEVRPATIKEEPSEERPAVSPHAWVETRPAPIKQEVVKERLAVIIQEPAEDQTATFEQEAAQDLPTTIGEEKTTECPVRVDQEMAEVQQLLLAPKVKREPSAFAEDLPINFSQPHAIDTFHPLETESDLGQQELSHDEREQLDETTELGVEADATAVLSPKSSQRMAKAWVRLARIHTQQGKLASAVEYFRKAESCQPGNSRLQERILKLEYCIKNNKPYVQSPTRRRQSRSSHSPHNSHSRDGGRSASSIQNRHIPAHNQDRHAGGSSRHSTKPPAHTPAKRKMPDFLKSGLSDDEPDPTAAPKKRRSSDR
ncbi:P-loop containing nucleoside triphosphate hydrolase protein [Pterulicium gracile]|uniref:Kinesin-like protein n=1 Tax=Pterulicium gracile TaxID=1884261 RepID=A0A5C3QHH7_9AGAR|nr:P-loop containing nucleoside triphosphate hydrolase protein [Pterula gracilis]